MWRVAMSDEPQNQVFPHLTDTQTVTAESIYHALTRRSDLSAILRQWMLPAIVFMEKQTGELDACPEVSLRAMPPYRVIATFDSDMLNDLILIYERDGEPGAVKLIDDWELGRDIQEER